MRNGNSGKGLVREERLQIMLSPEELKAIDHFRFEHRMPSRGCGGSRTAPARDRCRGRCNRQHRHQVSRLRGAEFSEGPEPEF